MASPSRVQNSFRSVYAGARISSTENGNARQHEKCDREGNQGRVGEEGSKPSPVKDGEAKIGKGAIMAMRINLGGSSWASGVDASHFI
jgi:hypothetical protein